MSLEQRVQEIETKIEQSIKRSGRNPGTVTLVAVSKLQTIDKIQQYCRYQLSRGKSLVIGENYVQEFRDKKESLADKFEAHMIGPLQRNKVKLAVSLFDVIQTVDSERLLAEISKEAVKINKIQSVFLQINISKDEAKSGFLPESLTESLLNTLTKYPSIKIEGLMAITRLYEEPQQARGDFRQLNLLGNTIKSYLSLPQCCLSMGMSDDFEVAIEEGATHVRIGTALFGERQY